MQAEEDKNIDRNQANDDSLIVPEGESILPKSIIEEKKTEIEDVIGAPSFRVLTIEQANDLATERAKVGTFLDNSLDKKDLSILVTDLLLVSRHKVTMPDNHPGGYNWERGVFGVLETYLGKRKMLRKHETYRHKPGEYSYLGSDIRRFISLDNTAAQILISNDHINILAEFIEYFENLDLKYAKILIENNFPLEVVSNIDQTFGGDKSGIAKILSENGYETILEDNKDIFKDCDSDTSCKISPDLFAKFRLSKEELEKMKNEIGILIKKYDRHSPDKSRNIRITEYLGGFENASDLVKKPDKLFKYIIASLKLRPITFNHIISWVGENIAHELTRILNILISSIEEIGKDKETEYQIFILLEFIIRELKKLNHSTIHGFERTFDIFENYAKSMLNENISYFIRVKFQEIIDIKNLNINDYPSIEAADDNYNLRIKNGIYENTFEGECLRQIADGYLASYDGNQLKAIYKTDNPEIPQLDYCSNEEVYKYLDEIADGDYHYWDAFFTYEGHRQLIDTKKINKSKINPKFYNQILQRNLVLYEEKAKKTNKPISAEDFFDLVYPEKKHSEIDIDKYLMLTSSEVVNSIQMDLGVNLTEYEIWIQRAFMEYIASKSKDEIDIIKKFLLTGNTRARLMTLTATTEDGEFEYILFQLGKHKNNDKLFKKYAEIVSYVNRQTDVLRANLKSQIGAQVQFDSQKFNSVILRKAKEEFIKSMGVGVSKFAKIDSQIMIWGALFAAISRDNSGIPTNPNLINDLFKSIKIDIFEAGNLVKSSNRDAMRQDDNYLEPEKFNKKDYEMIVSNLWQTYDKIDQKWMEYLINHIPLDLNNPDVKFILIRNQNNQLIGLCKIKPVPGAENTFYFGTHYVSPEYQKGFDIGSYIEEMARSVIPADAKIIATVAIANPAMERHIDSRNGIGKNISFEGSDPENSNELIEFEWNYDGKYESKDEKIFTREKIKQMAITGEQHEPADGSILAFKFNTSTGKNTEFIETCKKLFGKGYVITRLFYDTKNGKQDLNSTYVVFELAADEIADEAAA